MKKIDKLLIKSFIGPCVVSFMIALFVLTMQYLWVHIDTIMGRGVSFFTLIEIVGYLSVSLFPMALPLGVLISSVMVMGNLSERYELTSLKSAGIPLVRTMMPLAVACAMIAVFSFLSSNYIIPFTNLQFKSKLYDISNKKATLNLKEGVFNYDFQGFVIYIGKKDKNGKDIEDLIIYDEKNATSQGLSVITAKRGEMYTVQDGKYFIMNLYDGVRNQEANKRYSSTDKNYPFVRTRFKKHHIVFDLSQFDSKETDQELFKSHQSMLSVGQLVTAIDSLDRKLEGRYTQLHKNVYKNFYIEMRKDTANFAHVWKKKKNVKVENDSLHLSKNKPTGSKQTKGGTAEANKSKITAVKNSAKKIKSIKKSSALKNYSPKQKLTKPLEDYAHFAETFILKDRAQIFAKAKAAARSIQSAANSSFRSLDLEKEKKVKHVFLMHTKFTYAFICLLFLFIGGPMGAIIRKGGFGMPLLVSIGFFVAFIFLNLLFEKLAESFVIQAALAAWTPILILVPIAGLLTYQAMSDKQIISFEKFSTGFAAIKKNYRWARLFFGEG